jgi:integrase/recombinase XerC
MTEITTISGGGLALYSQETISVEDAIRLWLAKYRSDETRRAYAGEIAAFAKFLRQRPSEAMAHFLSLEDHQAHTLIDAYKASMLNRQPRPLSTATINRALSALASFTKSARRHGLTTLRLDVELVGALKYKDTRGPGVANIMRMIREAKGQHNPWKASRDVAMLRLLFSMALRRAELVGIDMEHLDADAGTVKIKGKGRAEYAVMSVPPAALASVKTWISVRGDHEGALFLAVDTRARLTSSGVYDIVKRISHKLGFQARPHGIRHTAITAVLDAVNGDVRKAQAFARHTNAATTMIYDDNREDLGGAAARMIDAMIE